MTSTRRHFGARLYHLLPPSPIFLRHPFKIYEFAEMLRLAPPQRSQTVLDLGCGAGRQSTFLARRAGHVFALDPSADMIARAEKVLAQARAQNITLRHAELANAGFGDGFFDAAYSFSVIEHVKHLPALFREVLRVLKPGGRFIVSTDSLAQIDDPGFISRHNALCSVVTLFSSASLKAMFSDAGFAEVHVHPICTSDFAAREFVQAEDRQHQYRMIPGLWTAARLRWLDHIHPGREQGIFLIGAGTKPGAPR